MIEAVIFDLDGVIVTTDEYHYLAWLSIAEQEGIPFDHMVNNRLRGVSRMESLEIILERASRTYSGEDKLGLAEQKNEKYRESLAQLSKQDLLPGVEQVLNELKARGVKIAIGSSSKNTPTILHQVELDQMFDAIADGNEITNSKPHPEVFLLAATKLGVEPAVCLVVEDAEAGVQAALRAAMQVAAVGDATHCGAAHHNLAKIEELLDII